MVLRVMKILNTLGLRHLFHKQIFGYMHVAACMVQLILTDVPQTMYLLAKLVCHPADQKFKLLRGSCVGGVLIPMPSTDEDTEKNSSPLLVLLLTLT